MSKVNRTGTTSLHDSFELSDGLLIPFFLDRLEDLLHNFRVKNRTRMKWDNHSTCSLRIDIDGSLSIAKGGSTQLTAPSQPREQSTEEV